MHHQKTKKLITDLGLKGSVLCEVLGVSQAQFSNKMNEYNYNKFNETDYNRILEFVKSKI